MRNQLLWKPFLGLMLGLALFSCKTDPADDPNIKPEDNRFTKVVLTEGMDEPMEMTFLPGNRVLFVERKGGVKILDETTGEVTLVATIPVNTKYTNKAGVTREAEEGLMGVIAHPDYEKNNWIYMYYADPTDTKHVLARWELKGNELVESSKKIVLEVPTQREECCHTGGGMVFDAEGNLYLTVGNNTVNPREGSSNLDERPGMENSDDQRAPGNTNDLRGKILRIHPEDDGSYTIPEGNLFPPGTEKTRPEIYTMGHRNPWRPTLDSKTGYLYWGEVGPDASVDSIWGPKGYDEFNQAKGPGFFGWPYFIGDNFPYNRHNHADSSYGAPYDVNAPVNESVNNTGLRELPTPVVPAMIYYPYGASEKFPELGTSGRSATGGPVFRKADFKKDAPYVFPAYYEGKWLIVDFMRGWIFAVTMDENGDYVSMERFLPNETFSSAIDMDFGPDGSLYILEYGSAWFRGNANSRLIKIQFNRGNRKPNVAASVDKTAGATPLAVNFSSEGTNDFDDYDQGNLKFEWKITNTSGFNQILTEANPSFTFAEAGTYQVVVTVTDTKGETNSASLEVTAGNEPPAVSIDFGGMNRSFWFGDKDLNYIISVSDKEDGSSSDGTIKPEEVAVTFDYVPAGFDPIEVASKQSGVESAAILNLGKNLIEQSDCKSCHQYTEKSIGPSYQAVAEKYPNSAENTAYLVNKIINGGAGVWGDHAMSAHPSLSEADAKRMVDYILAMDDVQANIASLPLSGKVEAVIPEGENGQGSFLLRASYSDKGSGAIGSLNGVDFVALKAPFVDPQTSVDRKGVQLLTTPRVSFMMAGDNSQFALKGIDLTGIQEIDVLASITSRNGAIGGSVEIRLGSPTGEVLGTSDKIGIKEGGGFRPPQGVSMQEWIRMNANRAKVQIKSTSGIQDLYFIFKNPDAKGEQVLMSINEIEFKNKIED
ncbi:PQQ-dependent sugar dehydrogenase [Algoriphagus sanaruensis]|uniref:PKD domain-containing protein n=1 Tax=Algoriphagus sanaruensis TaxID=1727163 RepID=A0A142ELE5_9BACT|nr:PQQ-dependent sugar dehydrogenase [Algoriphagus sanaruensis]AMQ55950.1 PKD domain-containing protein [Algoriphagus sanaruensis]